MKRSSRELASLAALAISGYLCLATSPVDDGPPVRATLEVPLGASETSRRVRLLMTGWRVNVSVAPGSPGEIVVESVSSDLRSVTCPNSSYSSRDLCFAQSESGFAEVTLRVERSPEWLEPTSITITALVEANSTSVPSSFSDARAYGVDLELLP